MKKRLGVFVTTIVFTAALALPTRLAAQQSRYRLVDLGTLGGPHGYGSPNGDGFSLLNNSGVVAFSADLPQPDPNSSFFCFNPDCFQTHAARWKEGTLTDIGALPGNNNSAAASINARGWAAGQSQSSTIDPIFGFPEFRNVLWKNGKIFDLGTLPGGTESLGIYVNDSGQVAGFSNNGVAEPFGFFFPTVTEIHATLWENGVLRDLGTLGGPESVPGASCGGQPRNVVVGASMVSGNANASTGFPTIDPFVWNNGVMTDLGGLGGTMGFGQCTNNRGQIIGQSNLSGDIVTHAFLWEGGVMTDLGTLGGDSSEAIWINDAGMIAGSADLPAPHIHDAVVWKDGKIQDLGTVDGDACSRGRGINARGQVVGGSSDCRNFLHAFVWEEGGPMQDLNALIAPGSGWQLTNAININDRGEILAKAAPVGFTPNDDEDLGHLVLLIPCEADEADCGSGTATNNLVPAAPNRVTTNTSLQQTSTPRNNVAAWRARFAKQYHVPTAARKN